MKSKDLKPKPTNKHYTYEIIPFAYILQNKTFSYSFNKKLSRGSLVKISFGRRFVSGTVLEERKQKPKYKLKPIKEVLYPSPVFSEAQIELANWIAKYYFTPLGMVLKMMAPKLLKRPRFKEIKIKKSEKKLELNKKQKKALKNILGKNQFHLLHGITGSGKTEVYMQIADELSRQDKQTIILVPEISITPQMQERLTKRFGSDSVAVFHSNLSQSEKFINWQRVKSSKAQIIVGPRSALFAPVQDLGAIILDEEHDDSFKQWESQPKFHAREVARKYAELTGAKLVLGDATPSVVTYNDAQNNKYQISELKERIWKQKLPSVEIIDTREELKKRNQSIFSEKLILEIKQTLKSKKQILLFLNRRGYHTYIKCEDCDYVAECPNCNIPLTYHSSGKLKCHYCSRHENFMMHCPKCGNPMMKLGGSGTERVESEIKSLFPKTKIARLDRDTTQKRGSQKKIYQEIKNNEADIIIGTQMITKGFDFKNLALVGIINADMSLYHADFRANEKTFNLLEQVAGRTSRGESQGKVLLQTYSPDHSAIRFAAAHNYLGFYKQEIKDRKKLKYPPFRNLIKIEVKTSKKEKSKSIAKSIIGDLNKKKIQALGPFSAGIQKSKWGYSYIIVIKLAKNESKNFLTQILKKFKRNIIIDIDPVTLV